MRTFLANSHHYIDFLDLFLRNGNPRRTRKGTGRLAEALRCHPTFIFKVLNHQAHLSQEQGLEFCRWGKLNEAESEFFLTLLARDRAGTDELRKYFDKQLLKQREFHQHVDAAVRPTKASLSLEDTVFYYSSWIPAALHLACQLPGQHTLISLAAKLQLQTNTLASILDKLQSIGILQQQSGFYTSLVEHIHAAKDNEFILNIHRNWRLKVLEDLNKDLDPKPVRYASVISLSKEADAQLRSLLLESLRSMQNILDEDTHPEELSMLTIDYYSLVKPK